MASADIVVLEYVLARKMFQKVTEMISEMVCRPRRPLRAGLRPGVEDVESRVWG